MGKKKTSLNEYNELEIRIVTTLDQISNQLSRITVLLQDRFGVKDVGPIPKATITEADFENWTMEDDWNAECLESLDE